MISATVGKVMEQYGTEEMSETSKFCLLFNRFFDCCNVRSLTEGHQKRNPDLMPYESPDDPRLQVFIFTKKSLIIYFSNTFYSPLIVT